MKKNNKIGLIIVLVLLGSACLFVGYTKYEQYKLNHNLIIKISEGGLICDTGGIYIYSDGRYKSFSPGIKSGKYDFDIDKVVKAIQEYEYDETRREQADTHLYYYKIEINKKYYYVYKGDIPILEEFLKSIGASGLIGC